MLKKETNQKVLQISGNDDHKTESLLDYLYHQNYCKRIDIDLKNQTNTNIPQQINYIGKLEEDYGAAMFFIAEKQQ